MQKNLYSRYKFINIVFLVFVIVSAITRTILLLKSVDMIDFSFIQLVKIYSVGAMYDFITASYLVIPFVLYIFVVPKKIFQHKIHRKATYVFIYILLYLLVFYAFSEWFFWDEFNVRFNFIAVDYLIYTTEVIGNIRESYPMGMLLSIIAVISASIFYILYKYNYISDILKDESSIKQRIIPTIILLIIPLTFFLKVSDDYSKISKNQYNKELSKSGLYSLVTAFGKNTLDYNKFYLSEDEKDVSTKLKSLLGINNTADLNSDNIDISRNILKTGAEKDYNVVIIVVESLSGMFLESLNGVKGLTPNLDSIAKESLFFNKFYATGTRTVRGMEAITLSIPPSAGRSIVKKSDNYNMFSSGFIFKNKGYDNKFIYGGHGYFDNMNEFFSHNGFNIVDKNNFTPSEDTFHTVWGVCDEDLLNKTLKEADLTYKAHKPFMNFVMTTTNHRPYDYPDGLVDIPSHTGREGAVKYTDYAIGEFIKKAKEKPWFKNTIFVIVADHCASSAGKAEIPLDKYHIPLIVYAPDILKPQIVEKISSQIDIMPTIFGILNWSYKSKFFGEDILSPSFKQRALIGTYQKLGLYEDNKLAVLSPGQKVHTYEVVEQNIYNTKYKEIPTDKNLQDDIIAYYQGISTLHKKRLDRYGEDK